MTNPLFSKALEDLAKMVFEELDLGMSLLWFEHKGHHDKFIRFLLMVYDIQCHIVVLEWLSAGLDEPNY
jgi:hypothetical protein